MPEAAASNHVMYVVARDHYLKYLLDTGKITSEQYEKMDRYLHGRFNIANIEKYMNPDDLIQMIELDSSPTSKTEPPSPTKAASKKPEYVSLTGLARQHNVDNPGYVIQSWMRSQNTIAFMNLWEKENNPEYDQQGYYDLVSRTGPFTLTPKQWIDQTKAIGMVSRQGKNGGTYAHPIITCEFMTWISPEFKLALIEMSQLPEVRHDG